MTRSRRHTGFATSPNGQPVTDDLRDRQIAAAKERFAALPERRRQELIAGFNKAQQAALFHLHYRRPE